MLAPVSSFTPPDVVAVFSASKLSPQRLRQQAKHDSETLRTCRTMQACRRLCPLRFPLNPQDPCSRVIL